MKEMRLINNIKVEYLVLSMILSNILFLNTKIPKYIFDAGKLHL